MSYQSDTPGNDNNAGNCKARAYTLCVRKKKRERESDTGEAPHTPRPDLRASWEQDSDKRMWQM